MIDMIKKEFMDQLREGLDGNVSYEKYRETIEYYESYFRRKIAEGKTEEEIVAELADNDISAKAKEIARLGISKEALKIPDSVGKDKYVQMSLFDAVNNDDIIDEIKDLELTKMTPIDALNTLFRIQDKIKNRW